MDKTYRLYSRQRGWENTDKDLPDRRYYTSSLISTKYNLDYLIGKNGYDILKNGIIKKNTDKHTTLLNLY